MFDEVLRAWKRSGLLKIALNKTIEMLEISKEMFNSALRMMIDVGAIEDLYAIDRKLNEYQMDIRKKILEHLAINPAVDVPASLVLVTIVVDIERIGDYSKNLVELARHYPEPLQGKYFDRIREMENKVSDMFPEVIESFKKGDKEKAKDIMEKHAKIAKESDFIIDHLIEDVKITAKDGIIAALLSRYLKRVSAHLKNVASSVVNPFHRIGYKPEEN